MADALPISREMTFSYGVGREVAPGVVRLVAENPSPFTFKGTNTYLFGTREVTVVDPGPASAAHLEAILAAAGERPIVRIMLTHTHRDHCDGLGALVEQTGAPTYAFDRDASDPAPRGTRETSPSGEDFTDSAFRPDVPLAHDATIEADGVIVRALHTPGHAPDHLCFALEGPAPAGEDNDAERVLFSGDHVMGWSTTVVAPPEGNMGDYLRSLELVRVRADTIYLPGHGGAIRTPQRVVKAYTMHRRWRESAILDSIRDGVATIDALVAKCYPGLEEALIPAAGLSVLAHVEHLIERGVVACDGPAVRDGVFSSV